MTMLEKMARAIGDEAATMDDDVRHVLSAGAIDRISRAALLAIREPDLSIKREGKYILPAYLMGDEEDDERAGQIFTAMIDAILSQKTD